MICYCAECEFSWHGKPGSVCIFCEQPETQARTPAWADQSLANQMTMVFGRPGMLR